MRLTILGVRGSTARPGAQFVRYGGHTSCVRGDGGGGPTRPTLLLDAGTGLRASDGDARPALPFTGSILLTHLHWDHVQGIPFFVAGDRPDARVNVFLPAAGRRSGRTCSRSRWSPPAFPIRPDGLLGAWAFHAIDAGPFPDRGLRP